MLGQEMDEARKDAVEKALAAKDAAEAQMREERALRDRMLQAAAAGQLPGQAQEDAEGGPETPGGAHDQPAQHPACGSPVMQSNAHHHTASRQRLWSLQQEPVEELRRSEVVEPVAL